MDSHQHIWQLVGDIKYCPCGATAKATRHEWLFVLGEQTAKAKMAHQDAGELVSNE